MSFPQPSMRKTRFVCVSDTHNAIPGGAFKLPKGDVLLHAGDMTNQGSFSELRKTVKWLEEADFETKIVVAGNHDITLDTEFYSLHGKNFHNQNPENPAKCQQLLESSPSIVWLKHGSAVINLRSPSGPRSTFKIFGSPYSRAHGNWAFGYEADRASRMWEDIPHDADIVMTHTPPRGHCDDAAGDQPTGCPALLEALRVVRPQLAVCGHIHEGRGVEFVRWCPPASVESLGGEHATKWQDPGKDNKKTSVVDLTTKLTNIPNSTETTATNDLDQSLSRALKGLETCVVNAAIMASSFHRRSEGKTFNKPIVVDINLPTWEV